MQKAVIYSVIVSLLLGLILGVCLTNRDRAAKERMLKLQTGVKNLKGEIDIQNAFIKVADKVGKAVVAVTTERTQRVGFKRPSFGGRGYATPFGGQDPLEKFFEDFFGQLPEKELKQRGLGSGFIIDEEGYILTNYHVVQGAQKISITLSDERTFEGAVKGADPRSDLAVIKIDAEDLPFVELGNSNLIQTGEWVVALGNPFGQVIMSPKPTVTAGVVSALHRRIPMPGGMTGYLDMIQTDAAINPGNSGGPLCDLDGKVIGINVAIFSTTGGYQGVGFAIPVNMVKDILEDLKTGREITYGWLGVVVQEITPEMAQYFKLPDTKGALISQIVPGSPAEKAGLKEGDVIVSFDGKKLDNIHDLLKEVAAAKAGRAIGLDIIRDGVKQTVEAKIEKKPALGEAEVAGEKKPGEESKEWRGIIVTNITDEIAYELGLKDKTGVVILDVDPESPSYEAGLRKGDVIKEINRIRLKDMNDYNNVISRVTGAALMRTDKGYFIVREK